MTYYIGDTPEHRMGPFADFTRAFDMWAVFRTRGPVFVWDAEGNDITHIMEELL